MVYCEFTELRRLPGIWGNVYSCCEISMGCGLHHFFGSGILDDPARPRFGMNRQGCLPITDDWLLVCFYVDNIAVLYRKADLPKFYQLKEDLMR
jgi:hypothetical protein